MKKNIFVILLFNFIFFSGMNGLNAQKERIDFSNYKNLEHSGDLPADVTTSTASKYQKDSRSISSKESRSVQKAQDQFYQESNFLLDELLASGKVFFNDPITKYVNEVVDELLKDDPQLRKELRIYSVKNATANAFTTNDGKILVNWGLLNKLENEAQLAAIMAHEIVHYRDKHVIDSYTESVKIQKGLGLYTRFSELDRITATTNFSKEKEIEADLGGVDIYLQSDYPPSEFVEIFDVLAYSHIPFKEATFPINFFNYDSLFVISEDIIEENYNEIEPENGEESDTHPGLTERKGKSNDKLGIEEIKESDKPIPANLYLVSEQKFKEAQNIARYELSKLYLYQKNYPLAIYHSWLLLEKDPQNAYLHKNIIKAVYGIAKFKNYAEYYDILGNVDIEDLQGKSKRVYDLFEELNPKSSTILALTMAKKYLDKFDAEDIEVNRMTEDLIKELVVAHDFTKNSFEEEKSLFKNQRIKVLSRNKGRWLADDQNEDGGDQIGKVEEVEFEIGNSSIIDTTKLGEELSIDKEEEPEKKKEKVLNKRIECDLSFVVEKEEYKRLISKIILNKEQLKEKRVILSEQEYYEVRKQITEEGFSLGEDKIIVVDPFYLKTDYRREYPIDYLAIEDAEAEVVDLIKENAALLDLNLEVLSAEKMTKNSAEAFADMAFLKYWFTEKMDNGRVDLVSVDYEKALDLSKKYQTPAFMWTGVLSSKYKRKRAVFGGAALLIVFYPQFIPRLLGPKKETFFYNFIFDLEEDKLVMFDFNELKLGDSNAVLKSNIYFQLLQIKRK